MRIVPAHSPSRCQRGSQACVPREAGMLGSDCPEPNGIVGTSMHFEIAARGTAVFPRRFYSDWKLRGARHALSILGGVAVRADGYVVGHVRAASRYRITTVIVSVSQDTPRLPSWKGSADWPGLSLCSPVTKPLAVHGVARKRNWRMADSTARAWSAQEDVDLLTSIERGCSISDIASQLGRTAAECRARLDEITRAPDSVFPRETAAS